MNSKNTIECPKCQHSFEMTEALLKQVSQQAEASLQDRLAEERARLSREAAEKIAAAAEESARLRLEAEEAARQLREEAVAAAVRLEQERQAQQEQLRIQREKIQQESLNALTRQLSEMQEQNQKLAESQRLAEITARQQAEAAAQVRIAAVSAEIEQRLSQDIAREKQESELRAKELELQLGTLREQLAHANNRANQISQQNQGAALEASVEEQLRTAFPRDTVSDVPAGVNGADVMLDVFNDSGAPCGRILFEVKRTQSWSNDWTGKLGEDMHRAKADVGVIITQTMPRDMKTPGIRDGVWVTDFASAMTLIRSLRWGVQEAALQKRIAEQSGEASAVLFDFVTSNDFRNRVQTILKTYASMHDALTKEKRAMQKMWELRQAHLDALTKHTTHVITNIEVKSGHQIEDMGALFLEDEAGESAEDDSAHEAPLAQAFLAGDDLGQHCEIFLSKLRKLGGSAGNKALRFELIWDSEKFERVKEHLISLGQIVRGAGKGGSVRLSGEENPGE